MAKILADFHSLFYFLTPCPTLPHTAQHCPMLPNALRGFLAADKKGGLSVRGVHTNVHDPNRKPA